MGGGLGGVLAGSGADISIKRLLRTINWISDTIHRHFHLKFEKLNSCFSIKFHSKIKVRKLKFRGEIRFCKLLINKEMFLE